MQLTGRGITATVAFTIVTLGFTLVMLSLSWVELLKLLPHTTSLTTLAVAFCCSSSPSCPVSKSIMSWMAKRLSVLEPVSKPDTNATYLQVKFDWIFHNRLWLLFPMRGASLPRSGKTSTISLYSLYCMSKWYKCSIGHEIFWKFWKIK